MTDDVFTEDQEASWVRLERDPSGALVVFHRTTNAAASAILADGFRDWTGTYMLGVELVGVWISNRPLNRGQGTKGDALLRIVLAASEDDLAEFEIVEHEKTYREWCVPAAMLNARGRATISEDT
jgi:hypothetical protein